jgi:arsenite methyltransferase
MVNKDNRQQQQKQEIKKAIRTTYSKIAQQEKNTNNESGPSSSPCCAPGCCSGGAESPAQVAAVIGYDTKELESIPQASILGVGCGAPVNFADLQKGETVVDLAQEQELMYFCLQRRSAMRVELSG